MITKKDVPQCFQLLERLNKIGVALSTEKSHTKLLEMILSEAMHLTNADGGTLYLVYKKNRLSFAIFANESLRIKPQSMIDIGLPVTSIPLFIHGKPNLKNVASYCYHQNKTVFIQDAYQDKELVFSGMKKVDKKLGYQSRSFLNVPLRDHEGNTIGILQLINARDTATGTIISFRKEMGLAVESLASQAAITLTKQELIQSQKKYSIPCCR
ncbi:hypothetical protein AQUSIP_11530 [Aquicella siphonis]|uniref:GAF domain-containing protein n=1 Tax=Aquicella siphonis TaxID=254247 RepID=A0A5E4PHQ3_9COXI|nr:GAF domain-containing protein [Aquicella siphonis]VVC75856.1 hypothetical protein AQUSIP_11530 [Aquicella siphonis]